MNFNLFVFLYLTISFNNCLCQNFLTEPLQKIKAEIPKTQWTFLQYEFSHNHLDIYKFRYQPHAIVIEAGASALGEEALENANIPFSVTEIDLHEAVEKDKNETKKKPGIVKGSITFQRTLIYDEILSYLSNIPKKSTNYRRISVEYIGRSYEMRDIKMVKIEHPAAKNIMFFDAGIHGREWITVMTALYLIVRLIDADIDDDINYMNWYIVPCVNPDGFVHSHEKYMFHRGNRNLTGCPKLCPVCGVDLNRNFGYKWRADGLTRSNCSFINPGSHAFSELESLALAETLKKYADNIKLYISMQSYGCEFLFPWSYDEKPCNNSEDLITAAKISAGLMNSLKGTPQCRFDVQNYGIMPTAGSSTDYAKAILNIEYVYTLKLQNGGRTGFCPNETQIQDFVQQNYAGIKDISHYINTKTGGYIKDSRKTFEPPQKKSGCGSIYLVDFSMYILLYITIVLT